MCQRSRNWRVVNTYDGTSYEMHCHTYSCPDCGPYRVRRLRKALNIYLQKWEKIRFWTFTLSSAHFDNQIDHLKVLREAWQRFVTYIRRTKSLSFNQRSFGYVKVFEPHKSGYFHMHVFVSVYLPWNIIQNIWENICKELLSTDLHCAFCLVKKCPNPKFAAFYVSKYVLKSAQEIDYYFSRYSTSRDVRLFKKKPKNGDWIVLNYDKDIWPQLAKFGFHDLPLVHIFYTNTSTNEDIRPLLNFCHDPPLLEVPSILDTCRHPSLY